MKKLRIIIILSLGMICNATYAQINDHVKIDKSEIQSEKINGFDKINWKSDFQTKEVGNPELPIYRVTYVLPIDAKIEEVNFTRKEKKLLKGNLLIAPVQQPILTNNIQPIGYTQPNNKIYEYNNPYPNKLYEIESDEIFQGYHIVTLLIYPFEYIPKSKIQNYYS